MDNIIVNMSIRTEPVDPIKLYVDVYTSETIHWKNWNHLFKMAFAFCEANDCHLHKMAKMKTGLGFTMSIFVKRRLGPPMRNNPMEKA